ncbi:MAG: exodeoxyribonuclease V subunit gamma [Gammaproteobacteria bacterium]|nr:exodeoxyribonuclease V subunit gamma [Gammaproteobacteria bacterium]
MLKLYQGNRLEYLADLLVALHRQQPPAPMEAEIVVVPHAGMARWLSLHIADVSGICANYRFPLPAGFLWETLNRLITELPAEDPYAPGVMQWTLFGLLGEVGDDARFKPVSAYLTGSGDGGRFDLAGQIAHCFDQYLVYRPDWIRAWEAGREAIAGDAWQAELWRRLRRRIRVPHWVDLERRLQRVLRDGKALPPLPRRISLFALPALSSGYLSILRQLAGRMDVDLFLLNPCREYWSGTLDPAERIGRELETPSQAHYLDTGNPLLASLGRGGRDLLAQLIDLDLPTIDLFDAPRQSGLLPQLQRDILELRDGTAEAARVVASDDLSFQLHSCHGPMREVEVLHDRLLQLFEREPELEPHQVVVMTPELVRYAPYIDAVFGAAAEHPLPFSIVGEEVDAAGDEIAALLRLLQMPDGRCDNDEVLALLETAAIRRRFDIGEEDLGVLRRWIEEAGIRWGEDGASRAALGLPANGGNSWRAGMERMLLGYALPGDGDHCFADLLPYAQSAEASAGLLGSLAEFVHVLFDCLDRLRGSHTPVEWCGRLLQLLSRMFDSEGDASRQPQRIRGGIDELRRRAELAGYSEPVPLELVRRELSRILQSGGSAGGMLGGGITFCGLAPARALPFDVVCLLGMNDGCFPAGVAQPGFDLMANNFRLGDRPRRVDDRYLFLQSLLAARHNLYISYTGQDLRDNSPLPPSVLVTELLDYLQHAFRYSDGTAIDARWPLRHPLQPFSAAYFQGSGALFSYRQQMAAAARANLQPGHAARPLLPRPLPPPEPEWRVVALPALKAFYFNPTRYLLRERLGLRLEREQPPLEPRDPFEIDYFERERLGRRMIELELSDGSTSALQAVERAAGRLPHGSAGEAQFSELAQRAAGAAATLLRAGLALQREPEPIDLHIGAFRIRGQMLRPGPNGLNSVSFNPLPAGAQLALWIDHLLAQLTAAGSDGVRSRWLAAGELVQLQPVADAGARLELLLERYWQGLSAPLHLFPKSSLEYARLRRAGRDEEASLASAWGCWAGGFMRRAEWDNPYTRLAFPDGNALDEAFMQLSEELCGAYLAALEAG